MADLLLANDKFYAELTQDYEVGDTIIYLTNVPDNVPTLLVAAKDTVNETVFQITDKTLNSVTGVTRVSGANVELLTQTPITCLNNAEFINQFNAKLVPDGGDTGEVLKKKSNSDGDYEFGDIVALPDGGTTGQVLKKKSNSDGDTEWGDAGLDNEAIVDLIYPIGSIYISVTSTNPETLFGGTWVSFGAGKTLVGIDSSDTEFDTVEKTGGAKTHTLDTTQIPSHRHDIDFWYPSAGGVTGGARLRGDGSAANWNNANLTNNTGGGGAHNNLQPYIVTYMFKRTA